MSKMRYNEEHTSLFVCRVIDELKSLWDWFLVDCHASFEVVDATEMKITTLFNVANVKIVE